MCGFDALVKMGNRLRCAAPLINTFASVLPRLRGTAPCVLLTKSYKMALLVRERRCAPYLLSVLR